MTRFLLPPTKRRSSRIAIVLGLLLTAGAVFGEADALAVPEAFGFGHGVRGGEGGRVLLVNRLDDDPKQPQPGMLRWALLQPGRRVIRFAVGGDLELEDRVVIRSGELTVDGRDAPAGGVCVRGGALEFERCRDVLLTGFRVRLGDTTVLKKLKREKRKRPATSSGLDCISLHECEGVVLDHLSLSWCCDELLAVVRCQRVTVQWCLLAEPLGQARLHPYGDNHAFGLLASASTLTVHHCVMARYWMRGPQFEANDMRRNDRWDVRMEAVSNVLFDFGRSGMRYTAGVEDHSQEARDRPFAFQFLGNLFLDTANTRRLIEVITRHGTHPGVAVWMEGNWEARPGGTMVPVSEAVLDDGRRLAAGSRDLRRQQVKSPLFASPHPPAVDLGGPGLERLLQSVGAGPERDAADQRILSDLLRGVSRPMLKTQREVE